MTSLWVAGLAHVLLMAGAEGSPGDGGVASMPEMGLRVVLHASVAPDELALARITAEELLAAAGVRTGWEQCSALESVCDDGAAGGLVIRLLGTRAAGRVSGHLVRDHRQGSTALVHVPVHGQLLQKVRTSAAARANPALSSLRLGHLIGLTIAHEVGHALSLRHTSAGVMKSNAGIDDLLALRRSRLAFSAAEMVQMRRAAEASASQLARRAP